MKHTKRLLTILLATALMVTMIPVGTGFGASKTPVGKVNVRIEDTIATPAGEDWQAPQGVMLDKQVNIYEDDTVFDVVVRTCKENKIKLKTTGGSYVTEVGSLKAASRGESSGWMFKMNEWFPNQGLDCYTVAGGELQDGDDLVLQYTLNWGADLGADFMDTDTRLAALSADKGMLTPAFDPEVKEYTLNLPKNAASVTLTASMHNKFNKASGMADGVPVHSLKNIAVKDGTEIAINCTDAMNADLGSYTVKVALTLDEDPAERIKAGVENTTIKASSAAGKSNGTSYIRVKWAKSKGYKVDYYEIYKSTKKGVFSDKPYFKTSNGTWKSYKNTKGVKKGIRYYYKVRGVREVGGETVYTKWSNQAIRTAK